MNKSNHYYRGSIIPYEELKYFIEPINMNINIPFESVTNFVTNNSNFIDFLIVEYNLLLNSIPTLKKKIPNKYSIPISCITYNTHIDGYDFRFNPIDIFNNIFKYLKLDYQIPFINLDNEDGMNYLKDYVIIYIKDIKRKNDDEDIIAIVQEINDNLDSICDIYNYKLESELEKCIIPKDALFFIAYHSLELFEETKQDEYMVIPYEYYHYVSHMNTSQYPHQIFLPNFSTNYMNKLWFGDFRKDYEKMIGKDKEISESDYLLKKRDILLACDILPPGNLETELKNIYQKEKSKPNVDYDKYQRLFNMKMNYYSKSKYINKIIGKYGLSGYIGFVYQNQYLLFDKFYNSDTIDPSKKTILTHGEAIYALPSDKFGILHGATKQNIIEEKETDERIKKINHTITGSFLNRIDKIIYGPNLSKCTFDEIIEREKGKMLIKK